MALAKFQEVLGRRIEGHALRRKLILNGAAEQGQYLVGGVVADGQCAVHHQSGFGKYLAPGVGLENAPAGESRNDGRGEKHGRERQVDANQQAHRAVIAPAVMMISKDIGAVRNAFLSVSPGDITSYTKWYASLRQHRSPADRPSLVRICEWRSHAGHRGRGAALLERICAISGRAGAAQCRTAAAAGRVAVADRCLAPPASGRRLRSRALQGAPARHRLFGAGEFCICRRHRPMSIRRSPTSQVRNWWCR